MADAQPKHRQKVFKKASPNEKITAYIGKRDFYVNADRADPIDGMVTLTKQYLQGRKVFAQLTCTFHHGSENLDVLGMDMSHQLYRRCVQVYPPRDAEEGGSLTRLQRKLRSKLGEDSYPFTFEIPASMPSSVTIQQSARERSAAGKRFGVDHEICVFVGSSEDDKIRKRSSVRLNVRKLAYALKPEERDDSTAGQAVATKGFTFSKGPVTLNVSLEKPLVFHGEPVKIHVKVDNQSRKAVKSVSIKMRQLATLKVRGGASLKSQCTIAALASNIGFPIAAGENASHSYELIPSQSDNADQSALALDGQLKDENTNLASSTPASDVANDVGGISVTYNVKVKLLIGLKGKLKVTLPIVLAIEPPSAPSKGIAATADAPLQPPNEAFDEPDDLELLFEDFVRGRAEKFFGEDKHVSKASKADEEEESGDES